MINDSKHSRCPDGERGGGTVSRPARADEQSRGRDSGIRTLVNCQSEQGPSATLRSVGKRPP